MEKNFWVSGGVFLKCFLEGVGGNGFVLSSGWQGFSLTTFTCRVCICSCLLPDETPHFQ